MAKLGVKTVIDLRGAEHSEADEKRIVEAAGMHYVSIPMRGMARPTDDQIAKALSLMNDEGAGPVFIHCKRGADRTGATVACYRIQHDHWTSDKALNEARAFGMSWFQLALQNYVSNFGNGGSASIPALISPGAGLAH
jgi:protein tyrosine/serine phosphatase